VLIAKPLRVLRPILHAARAPGLPRTRHTALAVSPAQRCADKVAVINNGDLP
jgi:hypothetical protein